MKKFIPLSLALLFAFITSAGAYHYLTNRESVSIASPAGIATAPVAIANHDLQMGSLITEDDIALQNWPLDIVSKNHFKNKGSLIGRTLKANLIKDEPITEPKLLGEDENISNLIPPNRRGVTIITKRSKTLARVLEKGTVVDVISVANGEESGVVAHNAVVMSVDGAEKSPTNVSGSKGNMELLLLVKSRDAVSLAQAKNAGSTEVVLSNKLSTILEIS